MLKHVKHLPAFALATAVTGCSTMTDKLITYDSKNSAQWDDVKDWYLCGS